MLRLHALRDATGSALLATFLLIGVTATPASAAPTPAQVGSWSAPIPLGVIGVHAALLPTGKVLYYELPGSTLGHARVFDPLTGQSTPADPHLAWSVFCSGLSFMPDGRVFATGGEPPRTPQNPVGTGVANDAFFDPATQTWSGGPPMTFARWYPSNVNMPDGSVMVMGGERVPVEAGGTYLVPRVESLDPGTDAWTTLPTSANISVLYPRAMLLPNGHVLVAGPQRMTKELDPATDQWTSIASMTFGNRNGGGVVLLPGLQKVLTSGGYGGNETATRTAEVLNLASSSPHWTSTGSMATARAHHNLVLLPDGTVLAVGGGQQGNFGTPVKSSELYDPATGTWQTMASQAAPRSYHSTALLLPDGRVISAGSNSGTSYETTVEIYSPPYLFKGARPTITSAPTAISFGGGFDVQTPDAGGIARVALMRLGATTHGWAQEQRYVDLSFTRGNGVLHITGPANAAVAPAGPYMLFILDGNGVPSVAPIMSLGAAPPTHALDVGIQGGGTGTISSDVGGIHCPGTCRSAGLPSDTEVVLTADPDPGSAFAGWGGDCSGVSMTCQLTMDVDHTVSARFEPAVEMDVSLAGSGTGTVRAPPNDEIDCPGACVAGFSEGRSVTLEAVADPDAIFTGWSGDCTGPGTCEVTMDVPHSVTATFQPALALHVLRTGSGAGTVTNDGGAIDCGTTCDAGFLSGTVVTLLAGEAPNATFASWTGDTDGACDTGPDCVVTMDHVRTITANYDPILHPLSVTSAGAGAGAVTSLAPNEGIIDCGSTCLADVQQGTSVTLHAVPDPGSIFIGWDGDCSGTGACTVAMDGARSVGVTFEPGWDLHVRPIGEGAGAVTSDVGGIDCGSACDRGIQAGTAVTLHAGDAPNATFASWDGDTDGACQGTGDCVVMMDRERTVTARYDPILDSLSVSTTGSGSGTVTSLAPNAGIDCGATCAATFQQGSSVTLRASPGANSVFTGWSGDTQVDEETGGCLTASVCALPIDRARSVTATFAAVVSGTPVPNDDAMVAYNGWAGVVDPGAAGGAYRVSAVKNDTATWTSQSSTSIKWIARTGPDEGIGSMTIDGKKKPPVDLYTPAPGTVINVYSGLTKKAHAVVIKVLGTKNASSTGSGVSLDAFVAGAFTTQESDPHVKYDTWKGVAQAKATDGTYRVATAGTATASVTFTGTSIDWITTKGAGFGQASVSIDGVPKGTVDLYQTATVWQSAVTFGGLASGTHTMVIHVLGLKNAAATATKVVMDGFIVYS